MGWQRVCASVMAIAVSVVPATAQRGGVRHQPQAPSPTAPAATKPSLSPLEQQLIEQAKRFADAFANKDANYVKRTLAEDFMAIAKNGDSQNAAEFMGDLHFPDKEDKDQKGEGPARRYDFKVLALNPDAALVTYSQIDPGDTPRYLHITDIWVRQAGEWKLKFQQSTPNVWSADDQ